MDRALSIPPVYCILFYFYLFNFFFPCDRGGVPSFLELQHRPQW